MPVIQEISSDGKHVLINIKGRFDYKVSQDFRDAYRNISAHDSVTYHVNLSETDFMDSSALGMLLLLREHAKCRGGKVIISCPSQQVDKILRVANFEQLFEIVTAPLVAVGGGYEFSSRA
ncbi:MAG: STAS domain-containing protein [Gammaproteobacteria bacterium]